MSAGPGGGARSDGSPDRDEVATLDALAAEYVLGTLDGDARLVFERLVERDEAVRALVVGWEARLQGLSEGAPRREPPAALRTRVVEAVRGAGAGTSAPRTRVPDDPSPVGAPRRPPAGAGPALGAARDPEPSSEPSSGPPPAVRSRPVPRPVPPSVAAPEPREAANDAGWRAAAIAASVVAVALLALLAGGFPDAPTGDAADVATAAPSATSPAPTALSLLRDDEGRPRYLVEIDESDSSVRITALDAAPVARDASLQLWMADGASGELRAIGLLPDEPWSSLRLEGVPLVDREPAFAVSEEPPGGSPEAGPTGSVVFEGTVHPLGDAD